MLLPRKEGAAAVEAAEAEEIVAVEEAVGLEVVTSIREASGGLPLEPVKSAGMGTSHIRTVTNTGEKTSAGGTPATIRRFINLPWAVTSLSPPSIQTTIWYLQLRKGNHRHLPRRAVEPRVAI